VGEADGSQLIHCSPVAASLSLSLCLPGPSSQVVWLKRGMSVGGKPGVFTVQVPSALLPNGIDQ
jgi:hypothetical protein